MTIADMVIDTEHAKLSITYDGKQGDLQDPIAFDSTDEDIRHWAVEAIRGGIPGIPPTANVNLDGYKVDRYPAGDGMPINRITLRPKVTYGVRPS